MGNINKLWKIWAFERYQVFLYSNNLNYSSQVAFKGSLSSDKPLFILHNKNYICIKTNNRKRALIALPSPWNPCLGPSRHWDSIIKPWDFVVHNLMTIVAGPRSVLKTCTASAAMVLCHILPRHLEQASSEAPSVRTWEIGMSINLTSHFPIKYNDKHRCQDGHQKTLTLPIKFSAGHSLGANKRWLWSLPPPPPTCQVN